MQPPGPNLPRHPARLARDRAFTWLERTPTSARLELRDDDEPRALYPFAFRLEIAYAIAGNTLAITFTLDNPGDTTLPASFRRLPAFRWPLGEAGIPKEAHSLTFSHDEPAPIRRGPGGFIAPERHPNPVLNRRLPLSDALFQPSAIMDAPASTWVRYTAPNAPAVTVAWDFGFPNLGIRPCSTPPSSASNPGTAWPAQPAGTASSWTNPASCASPRRTPPRRAQHHGQRIRQDKPFFL